METIVPKGIIMILHEAFAPISPQACIAGMPENWQKMHKKEVKITYSEPMELGNTFDLDFSQFALEHKRQFQEKVLPLLQEYNDYTIAYFGFVPIPLGMDFGYQFHNYRNLEVFQYHHITKNWHQETENKTHGKNTLKPVSLFDRNQKGISTVLLRLSVSHPVNSEKTAKLIDSAAEIDLAFEKPSEDVVESRERMVEIGESVKSILDQIADNKSDIETVHVFAAVPCGVAFLIGSKISPNIHPYIQTYEYKRTEEVPYKKAILIKSELQVIPSLTEEERQKAQELRLSCDRELQERIVQFCVRSEGLADRVSQWPLDVVDINQHDGIMNEDFWSTLPFISKTSLKRDRFGSKFEVIQNGFQYENQEWQVDDFFFIALSRRIGDPAKQMQAIRLFLFHEVLHYHIHGLGDGREQNIGSFPKVLETADYQADVYALLNEYGFHKEHSGDIADCKTFFLEAIETAIETMWSFDDQGVELDQIQIRRVNRYLIWYWQAVRIEKHGDLLSDIIKILEEKPTIELTGLRTKEENNRFYFSLEKRENVPLELGVFFGNRIIRNGSATNLQIELLVEGIKEMNGEKISGVIKGFFPR